MEQFTEYITNSIKEIEQMDLDKQSKTMVVSRLDSICALLSITFYNLNEYKNEKVQNEEVRA